MQTGIVANQQNYQNEKLIGQRMKPSTDTKRFWLMLYTMEGFAKVVAACDYILKEEPEVNSEEYDRTITAILTIYGRAWHKNRGVGKLDEVLIPPPSLDLHRRLMEERDKAHAHKDANGLKSSIGNVNQIRLLRLRTGFTWMCGNRVAFEKKDIQAIRQLCKELIKKLDYHTDKYQKKIWRIIEALPEGEYLVNTEEDNANLFSKTEPIIPPDQRIQQHNCPYNPLRKGSLFLTE